MDHGNNDHCDSGSDLGGHITLDALFVAGHGCHSDGQVSFAFHGGTDSVAGNTAAIISTQDTSGTPAVKVNVPTMGEDGNAIRGYVCHISRHGNINVLSEFKTLAAQHGLIQIDGRRPGLDISNRVKYEILDFDAWTHAQELQEGRPYLEELFGARAKPNGWYPGATGSTTLIRQYWQVGKRKGFFGEPEFDDKASTYLEVSVIVWAYFESCDFETKLEVRVVSSPEWAERHQKWGYRGKPFENHQRVAIKSYLAMMELLIATKPSAAAELMRKQLDEQFPPNADVPEGTYAMTAEELLARDAASIQEIARNDQVARDNQQPGLPAADDASAGDTAELVVELDD